MKTKVKGFPYLKLLKWRGLEWIESLLPIRHSAAAAMVSDDFNPSASCNTFPRASLLI